MIHNNPFGINRRDRDQAPVGIMQIDTPDAPQLSQEPGIGQQIGEMAKNKAIGYGEDALMGALSPAAAPVATAAETAMAAELGTGIASAAPAAAGAGKGAAGAAGAAGAGAGGAGLMAAAAPMAAPLLIGGLLASKLF